MDCKHEIIHCKRCGSSFQCKVGSITQCQCMTVQLTDNERTYIRNTYEDCLCASCLLQLRKEYHEKNFKEKIETLMGTLRR